jgi:hypothetical protein
MVHREYDNLKFKRTYVGGSKKKEFEIFKQVQNSGGDCDWIEYKRILLPYLEDVAHVTFSRSYIARILSVVFMALALIFAVFSFSVLSITCLSLSILSRFIFFSFERKTKQALMSYNISYDIVRNEIKKSTGLEI